MSFNLNIVLPDYKPLIECGGKRKRSDEIVRDHQKFCDRYKLIRIIQKSMFGSVYEGFDMLNREKVAIKVSSLQMKKRDVHKSGM